MSQARDFILTGKVAFNGVKFIVRADTEADAIKKVELCEWDSLVTEGAEVTDWSVTKRTSD